MAGPAAETKADKPKKAVKKTKRVFIPTSITKNAQLEERENRRWVALLEPECPGWRDKRSAVRRKPRGEDGGRDNPERR